MGDCIARWGGAGRGWELVDRCATAETAQLSSAGCKAKHEIGQWDHGSPKRVDIVRSGVAGEGTATASNFANLMEDLGELDNDLGAVLLRIFARQAKTKLSAFE